jgi:hypothetical protein
MISEQQTAVPVAKKIITKSSKGCHDENTVLLCTTLQVCTHSLDIGKYSPPPYCISDAISGGGGRSTEKMEKVKEKV